MLIKLSNVVGSRRWSSSPKRSEVRIETEAVTLAPALRASAGEESLHPLFLLLTSFLFLLSSCAPKVSAAPAIVTVQASPAINAPIQVLASTPFPTGLQIGDSVPTLLRDQAKSWNLPKNAGARLDVSASPKPDEIQSHWVYALVAPFPTITDGVTSDELRLAWTQGTAPAPFNGHPLLMEASTLAAFTALWGKPAEGSVRSVPADQLLDTAWSEMPSWAIIPFEALEPKWKVLTIDGQSPIRKKFDQSKYPLVATFTLHSTEPSSLSLQPSNYDPSKLTTIIMTGVTALVRATAYTMELKSVKYPGEKIRDLMREADIAHVSNEIPFFTACKFPKPDQGALVFCSDPKYIDLLTDVGTDVIELTGNHFADYGPNAMLETLAIYKSKGIAYFGGGADLQDSLKPALFNVNGNKIAFIGCNKPDVGRFPTATDYQPGAAPCKFPYLTQKISELKSQGYVVISTFQWNESYDYRPAAQQEDDFRLMADSGAFIVSGSQAHYSQTMEFYNGAFIHYGLGNLFFDQMGDQSWMPRGIRREFFDRHVIYNGKYISTELLTAMLEDYSRPRLMTDAERAAYLQDYFYYSGWLPYFATPAPTITPTLTPMSIPPFAQTSVPPPSTIATPTP